MTWHLEGSFFEACPCDVACPCVTSAFNAPADVDRCRMVLAFHITSGEIEGVDVSHLNVALIGDTPPVMWDGNWRIGRFFDAAASDAQADKLRALFYGRLGGPMEMIASMTGEDLGEMVVPIKYDDDGRRHRVQLGDFADIEIEDFVPPQNPEGEVYRITGLFHPVSPTVTIATTTTSRFDAFGLRFSYPGKWGDAASFAWAA
jgi:hypothetical protein